MEDTANTSDVALSKTDSDQLNLNAFPAIQLLRLRGLGSSSPNVAGSGHLALASTNTSAWRKQRQSADVVYGQDSSDNDVRKQFLVVS